MEHRERLIALLDKYTSNAITEQEQADLFHLISTGDHDDLLEGHFSRQFSRKDLPGADMPDAMAHDLMQKILSAEKQNACLLPQINKSRTILRWSIAAAFTGVVLASLFFAFRPGSQAVYTSAFLHAGSMKEEVNRTSRPVQFLLEDSSVVTLQPGAALHYPAHFETFKREVYLDGEAFFSVSRNADRPFLVYYDNLVTHVLGTSFNVRPDRQKKLVEVSVRTGRVQVYEYRQAGFNPKKVNGVILTPNQKAIYREEERQFTATIVNDPLPLVKEALREPDAASTFVYEDAPMRTIIGALEKTYGIEIIVENEAVYNCLFTGDISMQDMYTRLDILCQSVKATYQISGTRILIEGKGCR